MGTEGELFVEHEEHDDAECPHVDFVTVFVLTVDFGTHITARSKHSLPFVRGFAEPEVCDFVNLRSQMSTFIPF
jgi:hypothetical protein